MLGGNHSQALYLTYQHITYMSLCHVLLCLHLYRECLKPSLISECCPTPPPIKFCNISILGWHVPFIKIKPGYKAQSILLPGGYKYFLIGNIWAVNTLEYFTYLLYEIESHVIWVTSLSPPNNFKCWGYKIYKICIRYRFKIILIKVWQNFLVVFPGRTEFEI